jgi:uncharacterized protein (TIGR02145 family)
MEIRHYSEKLLSFLLISIIILAGCRKDEMLIIDKVSGLVQKGPFINGTSVTIYELNRDLAQSGSSYNTQIDNNYGAFEINNIGLRSGFIRIVAEGYYYDEVKGNLSAAPVALYALSDVADRTVSVNVNLLTHLEKERIEYLIHGGIMFAQAKKIAQNDIMSIFGIDAANLNRSETLDLTDENEQGAILLAVSAILQGNRTAADLTEFLANISNDIREDGILNDEKILMELHSTARSLNTTNIRNKLQSRYLEVGIDKRIPDFEHYINQYLASTGAKPSAIVRQAENITSSGATLRGFVNANDLATTVSFEYGIGTEYTQTVPAAPQSINGHLNIPVSAGISDLSAAGQYHFRIKAVNSLGTTYSAGMPLVKSEPVSDIDGNTYNTVIIGNQVWMAENLKVTKYSDGTPLIETVNNSTWTSTISGAYCSYNNDPEKIKTFGRLYNSMAVNDSRNLCPAGWHVPALQDWTVLYDFLVTNGYGSMDFSMWIAKSVASTTGWITSTTAASPGNNQSDNNTSGFSGLPGGARSWDGTFFSSGYAGFWHVANPGELDLLRIIGNASSVFNQNYYKKPVGASVRCLKN